MAMGSCCGFAAPLPACSSTDVSLSLVWSGLAPAWVKSLMAPSTKNLHVQVCGASTPMLAHRNPGCGTDHWAGVTMRMLRSSTFLHRDDKGPPAWHISSRTVNKSMLPLWLAILRQPKALS
ncbi:hypothetical protein H0G86_005476 [Trichoderma simmonsii]|uniref:Uncharacterized protein n=1 Tax=Trichoderma simmonsii TaxID=1491479 RepID=A0A8G0LCI2_9HYPO|nr:hypothetical protein H0G86_005476 [Trichoderma simmonsii]